MNGDDPNRKILCDIARSGFEAVNRLLSRDQLLARDLRSSETGSRQIYREECITVEMAATLRERFPKYVDITLFTAPEEKRCGADWYWRFERGEHAIHARVQAKRVQRTAFGQVDDHGHIDIDLPQLTQLMQATTKATELSGLQAWLVTFARFNANPPCNKSNLEKCESHMHAPTCMNYRPSVWIAHAQEIAKTANGVRRPVRSIIEKSLRLDCLLPCIDYDSGSAASGPSSKGFALQHGVKPYQDCIAIIENDPMLRKEFEGALRIKV